MSAIDVWDHSFPEPGNQWGCFQLMPYLEQNSCYTTVMVRFRDIASVRLPGNRFRRRHLSPKSIRPGTWSRRWTVNLVTAGGARRAVVFINKSFLSFNFWNFQNVREKKKYPEFGVSNVRKTSRSSKKLKFEKKIVSAHMRFSTFDKCNLNQNHTENLAFATRTSQNFKKNLKNQNFIFSNVVGDRSLRLQLLRG